ncbi:MAG: SurA N-terminal domain-containing protein [Patescibacteria group bacterium]
MAKRVKKQKIDKQISPRVSIKLPKRVFLYVLILLVVGGLIYFGGKVFFVASINGQLVNRLSIVKELEKQGGKKVLDDLILKALINQEGKKRKINISEKEVDAEISKIEKNVTSQGATLEVLLQQQGMTKKDLTDGIRLQLLVSKMVDSNVIVTDKEIENYLAKQKEQSSLGLGQTVPEITRDQAGAAIKQQKLQAKIQTFVADLKAKAKINYFVKY